MKTITFGFRYGGAAAWDTPYEKTVEVDHNTTVCRYCFEDGLVVTNIQTRYPAFDAIESVNYFENVGEKNTKMISELYDCDTVFETGTGTKREHTAWIPDPESAALIYAPHGSDCSALEFSCNVGECEENKFKNALYVGEKVCFASDMGRSSSAANAPFFNMYDRGNGVIGAIGWTGQWNCEIERCENGVRFGCKIEDTEFFMEPGEKFRTMSVVFMEYSGNVTDAQNKWRRFLKQEFSPVKEGDRLPFSAGIWGGMASSDMIERCDFIRQHRIPFDCFWIDAGWHGSSGKVTPDEFDVTWWGQVGDWRVDPNIHPDELKDVRQTVKEAGMKFLLWVETECERAMRSAPIYREHPEYFISDGSEKVYTMLLNLGNKEAWQYCFDTLSALIGELEIDCYRQDFNCVNTLDYWRHNDKEGRKGITEIKHINGLYALLDALRAKYPDLLIDNCASGGRRIDIEMLKRSVPLWRSDAQCLANVPPEISQSHNVSFSQWLPYSGAGMGRQYDEYAIRSAYAGANMTQWTFSAGTKPENGEWIRRYAEEYLRIQPYFYADIYPMNEVTSKKEVWSAVQFDRPEHGDGMLQVFVREKAPYTDAVYFLEKINGDKTYLFEDFDGGTFEISGKELISHGLHLHIEEKRKAKIYIYNEK